MTLINKSDITLIKFFWPIIFIIFYIILCINLLSYSLDFKTHLNIIDLYESGKISSNNNFLSFLISNLSNISSEKIIYYSFITAIFIWPLSLFFLSRSSVVYFLLYSTIIPVINLNRQFIALSIGILLFKLFRTINFKYHLFIPFLGASILHFSTLFMNGILIYKTLKIRKYIFSLIILFIIICYFLVDLNLLPRFLVYSENPSGIQGNYIPSLILLFITSFSLNGKSLLIMNILNSLFIFCLFKNLERINQFNQFIYLSRFAWTQLFVDCIFFLVRTDKKLSYNYKIEQTLIYFSKKKHSLLIPIANTSLFTLGTYMLFATRVNLL